MFMNRLVGNWLAYSSGRRGQYVIYGLVLWIRVAAMAAVAVGHRRLAQGYAYGVSFDRSFARPIQPDDCPGGHGRRSRPTELAIQNRVDATKAYFELRQINKDYQASQRWPSFAAVDGAVLRAAKTPEEAVPLAVGPRDGQDQLARLLLRDAHLSALSRSD